LPCFFDEQRNRKRTNLFCSVSFFVWADFPFFRMSDQRGFLALVCVILFDCIFVKIDLLLYFAVVWQAFAQLHLSFWMTMMLTDIVVVVL